MQVDGYGTCDWCGWNGMLRKNGTMREHRVMADSGRSGSTGSLPQEKNGPTCKGSGQQPYAPLTEPVQERVPGTLVDPWTWIRSPLRHNG